MGAVDALHRHHSLQDLVITPIHLSHSASADAGLNGDVSYALSRFEHLFPC